MTIGRRLPRPRPTILPRASGSTGWVRVPALLVSPWIPASVDHTIHDHTSILRYACEKWGLPPLYRRIEPCAGANVIGTFAHAMSCAQVRTDTPLNLPMDAAHALAAAVPASTRFDDSQVALVCFAELA
jgi:phospholipase C